MKINASYKPELIGWSPTLALVLATIGARLFASYVLPQFDDSFIIFTSCEKPCDGVRVCIQSGFLYPWGKLSVIWNFGIVLFHALSSQDRNEIPLEKAPDVWNQNYVLFEKVAHEIKTRHFSY